MILIEAIFALGIAFFLTILFVALGRCARSRAAILVFFLLVFLGAWAGGIWIAPVGPRLMGVYWVSFFAVGLIFALLQGALNALPRSSKPCGRIAETEAKEGREIETVFDIFLFVLLVLFIVAIVIGYLHRLR